jgi:hypothetical protein
MLLKHLVRDLHLPNKVDDYRIAKPNRKIRPEVPIYLSVSLLPASLQGWGKDGNQIPRWEDLSSPRLLPPPPPPPPQCKVLPNWGPSITVGFSDVELSAQAPALANHTQVQQGAANHNISSQLITIAAGG